MGPWRTVTVVHFPTKHRAPGLPGLLGLVSLSVIHFWSTVRRQLAMVLIFGLLHTVFTVAAVFLLVPIVQAVSRGRSELELGPVAVDADPVVYIVLLATSIVLLAAGLRSDYRAHALSLEIQSNVTGKSITKTLAALLQYPVEYRTRRAVRELTGSIADSAGFAMRKVATGGSASVQAPVLFGILIWTQPVLTVIATIVVVPLVVLYSRSVRRIAVKVRNRKIENQKSREDLQQLVELLRDPTTTASSIESMVRLLIEGGSLGESVRLKESIRRERRWGPTTVASAFPLLLAILGVAAYVFDLFAGRIEWILVYVLVLRGLVWVIQELASSMISVARFHDSLACLFDLISGVPDPQCRFLGACKDGDNADEDDD